MFWIPPTFVWIVATCAPTCIILFSIAINDHRHRNNFCSLLKEFNMSYFFLGMMGSQIVETLFTPGLDTELVAKILDIILQFVPLYGLVTSTR